MTQSAALQRATSWEATQQLITVFNNHRRRNRTRQCSAP